LVFGDTHMLRQARSLLFWFCSGLALGQPATPHTKRITLEDSQLRVILSAQNGSLISVERKEDNASYLKSSSQSGWFRVQLPLSYWEGHAASSKDIPAMRLVKQTSDSVELQATALTSKAGNYKIDSRLAIRLEGDNIVCSLHLRNNSQQTIDSITFPIVGVPAAADAGEALHTPNLFQFGALRPMFSRNDIQTDQNPFDTLDQMDRRAWFSADPKITIKGLNYPMDLSTAWASYSADKQGVGLDVRTKDFQWQKFTIERRLHRDQRSRAANQQDYELAWHWYPLVQPGTSWRSAEVYIKFDHGDWHAIAKQHRDWLRTWITRPNPPREFRQSIGWMSHNIRSFDEIPVWAQKGLDVGVPYFLIYGWSEIGLGGMTYDSYPKKELGGIEALRSNLEAAKKLGSFPLAWFNGTTSVESNPEHMLMGYQWTAVDRWGAPILDGRWSLYDSSLVNSINENDEWFQLDPSTPAKAFLLDCEHRMVEDYGFSGNELDQAHKNYLSYREHADKTGPELAFSKGYGDFFAKAEAIVKKANPAGVLLGENPSELMNQYVDSTWIFEGGALPLSTLTTLRYSWPWATVPTRSVATNLGHANEAFMMNAPLDIFDDLTKYPEYAAHLKRLSMLKKAALDFFYQGDFSDQDGFSLSSAQKEVMAKSYREPEGKFTAVVVINSGASAGEAVLHPDASIANRKVQHLYLDGRTETENGTDEMHLSLPPYDVQILAFAP
jgi:hypothetical protein